eukprot:Opistho-2@58820
MASKKLKCFNKSCASDSNSKFLCPECRTNIYCTDACRLKDWEAVHRKNCKAIAKETKELTALLQENNRKNICKYFKVKTIDEITVDKFPSNLSLEGRNENGQAAIHIAVGTGDTEIVQLILKLGAYVDSRDRDGNTALHLATRAGNGAMARCILNFRPDINASNKRKDTAVHVAAETGNKLILVSLLGKSPDCTAANIDDMTPTQLAIVNGRIECVGLFFDQDEALRTPSLLADAIRANKPESIRFLADHGYSMALELPDGSTPMQFAEKCGHAGALKAIRDRLDALRQPATAAAQGLLASDDASGSARKSMMFTSAPAVASSATPAKTRVCEDSVVTPIFSQFQSPIAWLSSGNATRDEVFSALKAIAKASALAEEAARLAAHNAQGNEAIKGAADRVIDAIGRNSQDLKESLAWHFASADALAKRAHMARSADAAKRLAEAVKSLALGA